MIETDQQEQLSLAALHATCAKAGFAFEESGRIADGWGIDARAEVKERLDPESRWTEFSLKFQLKATKQDLTKTNRGFSFSLKVDQYEKLRQSDRKDPLYLVVYQMPRDPSEWLQSDAEQLILQRCLRYVSLRGAPPAETDRTTTVYVPELNLLTSDVLRELARKQSIEEWVDYSPLGALSVGDDDDYDEERTDA